MNENTDTRARSSLRYALPLHDGKRPMPPNYQRVVESLSDDELRHEAATGRGERGYQEAVAGELERRNRP